MKTPGYAVIKVNPRGEAKITKQWSAECTNVAKILSTSWKQNRRNGHSGGMRYFRLRCFSVDSDIWWVNPEHAALDGMAFHINEIFNCRCCFPEWLFSENEVAKAKGDVERRKATI
ncbi:TPA: hypothetical protein ACN9JA_004752 [Klebsiella pneumoniae]|uniref:hypothetical protein n=1 Tax=Raoultella ornithinolytica TaxID=54291 RepID=UPI0013C2A6F2|nr:hypothetical protein [Raoultella ornithinolytica]